MIYSALINNITLIIALSILYRFIVRRWKYGSRTGQAISGILFGAVAVVGMMNPLIISPGLIFDGRSIIISIAGFIGGWVTALVAALMGIIYRTWLGGPGGIMGVSVIASSAAIGVAYHYIRRRRPHVVTPLHLLGFGIIVHICMLALTMTLPSGMRYEVLSNIAMPVILIYPLGTLLVGVVLLELESRIRAEDALRESEGKYRTIIENIEDGYHEVDMKGNFTFFNESVCKIIGYERQEMLGMNNRQYADEEGARNVYQAYNRVYLTGKPLKNFEWQIIRKDGARRDVEVSISLIRNREGDPTGFRGIVRDTTERKRAEEEKRSLQERLQRAEKMEALGQLAGGVAHDLNNVLGILSGYSELLLLEIPEGHRSRGHAEKILQSTEKGAAIIQDLLTLARRGVTASDVVNLNGVVSGFLKTPVFEKMKDYHPRVTFRTECDPNLLNIKGSPIHLEKMLMNLVSNAAESISGKGEITIRTEGRYLDKAIRGYDEVKEGDYAVLTVSDTGMGIPAENREKIFEPFYTKKTMGRSGTGLGLAIVWGTVKDHNGYIDVETEVGEGTTFTLYFPVTREELISQQQKVPIERYMGNGESVLVVDDIAEQRDIAARLLTRLGYKVHAVSGGEEAVEYLRENKADILVLDMIMAPGIDGLETYRRVIEINPHQKAIIVSGFSETDRVREAQKLGAGAYVKKPYLMEKIGVAIRDELNR